MRRAYPAGSLVLAKAIDVGEVSARVALHPDVEVWLLGDPDGPPLTRMIDAGDVIAGQIDTDGDTLQCRLPETEDPPLPAEPVIPDGPPWLVPEDLVEDEEQVEVAPPEPAPREEVTQQAPATPQVPTPALLGQLEAANRERALLDTRLPRCRGGPRHCQGGGGATAPRPSERGEEGQAGGQASRGVGRPRPRDRRVR